MSADSKLSRSIVLVNEFSVPGVGRGPKGGTPGSRGGTPGDFVLRYMARKGATEPLAPVRQVDHEAFIRRYMAREGAVEQLRDGQFPALSRELSRAQGVGGVAFGYGSYALSDEALAHAAGDIQRLFDSGHTVMKTVLSFDEEYLRRHKLIPVDFQLEKAGDYRGNLDQLKLRLAVMRGLERMGRMCYDDLRYVAVAQIDTRHVHVHLAMVDAGAGRLAPDGTQRGKIGARAKSLLRRGVDAYLDEKRHVAHLSSAVHYEQRNTTAFVKRWAFRRFHEGSITQSLVAALPADRRLWRYGTNRQEMRRANQLATEFVEALLAHPDSGYTEAMDQVRRYADTRRRREGLTRPQRRRLIDQGRERIVERSVNGVFAVLRQLPEDALTISTPLLDQANTDPVPSWDTPGLGGFTARLRIAGGRLVRHQRSAAQFGELAETWREAERAGEASLDSVPMVRLFDIEKEYHQACAGKYASMLPLASSLDDDLRSRLEAAGEQGARLVALETLRKDTAIKRLKDPAEAERMGRLVYDEEGGWLLSRGDRDSLAVLDDRIQRRRARHRATLTRLEADVAARGLAISGTQTQPVAVPLPRRPELVAVDLHEADELWARAVPASAMEAFLSWSRLRVTALREARAYLVDSGQEHSLDGVALGDIAVMARVAAGGVVGRGASGQQQSVAAPVVEGGAGVAARATSTAARPMVRTVAVSSRQPREDLLRVVREATHEAADEVAHDLHEPLG